MNSCNCNIALANLGIQECPIDSFGFIAGALFFPTYKEDGSDNFIPVVGGGITQELLESLLYAENPYNRFQNLYNLSNAELVSANVEYKELNNNEKTRVNETPMSFSTGLNKVSFKLAKDLKNLSCDDVSVVFYDEYNNILGVDEGLTNVYGFKINMSTFDPKIIFAKKGETSSKIMLSFDLDINANNSDLIVIPSEFVTADLNTRSMIDINLTNNGSVEDLIKIVATQSFSNLFTNFYYIGKEDKFILLDNEQNEVTVSINEVSDGNYELSGTIPIGTYLIKGNDYENGFNIKQTIITI